MKAAAYVTERAVAAFAEAGCNAAPNEQMLEEAVRNALIYCHAENSMFIVEYMMQQWSVMITMLNAAKTVVVNIK